MKDTTLVLIILAVIMIAGIIIYNFDIYVNPTIYWMIFGFVFAIYIILYIFSSKGVIGKGTLETQLAMDAIKNYFNNENSPYPFRLRDLYRYTETTYEGLNKRYKAFIFDTDRNYQVVVIWNVNDGDISDIDIDPIPSRLANPFSYFNPYTGKFFVKEPEKKVKDAYVPIKLEQEKKEEEVYE